jgi:hypothetical protein
MAKGHKTGGRVAGTPNKRTQEVAGLLESLGCDPIEGMAQIAMNEKHSPELRGRMFAELAQYIAPKRKAIEHRLGEDEGRLSVAETLRLALDKVKVIESPLAPDTARQEPEEPGPIN